GNGGLCEPVVHCSSPDLRPLAPLLSVGPNVMDGTLCHLSALGEVTKSAMTLGNSATPPERFRRPCSRSNSPRRRGPCLRPSTQRPTSRRGVSRAQRRDPGLKTAG